jgi:anti-sigma factor RsiW
MSECTNGELRDLLPELVNDRLDAESRQRVEAHVASCTECAEELALLRSLRPALMHGPAIDTARIAAAVRARSADIAGRPPARSGMGSRWHLAAAAATVLAVGALGYVTRKPGIVAPRSVPVHAPPRQVASAPPHVAPPHVAAPSTPTAVASFGVLDNVSDLSDDDVRTLTASLDELSPVPDVDPSPGIDPLGASLEDPSAGGR